MTRPASAECKKHLIGESATDDDHLRKMAAAAWHGQGIAVINPEAINNDYDRQTVKNVANGLYGKRAKS